MEDEGEEVGLQMNSLPVDHPAIMLSEVEYQETLKRGNEEKLPAKKQKGNQKAGPLDRQECQPTSSQVRVEDLVTDDEDKRGLLQSRDVLGKELCQLWDCPVPSPAMDWGLDPRMPWEWNWLVASMIWADQRGGPEGGERY